MHVPARDVPVPAHLSEAAQTSLASNVPVPQAYPPLFDHEAWRSMIAAQNARLLAMPHAQPAGAATVETVDLGKTVAYDITPEGVCADDRRVHLDIHGGALIYGGGEVCRLRGIGSAQRAGVRTWSVDYRMPPDHPYPAGLDDCVAAYRLLLEEYEPASITVFGASAGGNLAAAMLLRARDEGLPLPAGVVLMTPQLDLTESGDSFKTNLGLDTVLTQSLMPVNRLYAGGAELDDPYVSPLFGDFTRGFPTALLSAGTRDLFLSNAVRMHRALRSAGVAAELHVIEAGPHGGFQGAAPEDWEIGSEIRRFLSEVRTGAARGNMSVPVFGPAKGAAS